VRLQLRAKLVLLFFACVSVAVLVVAAVAVRQFDRFERDRSERALRTEARSVAAIVEKRQQNQLGNFGRRGAFIPNLQKASGVDAIFYAPNAKLSPGTVPLRVAHLPEAYVRQLNWTRLGSDPGYTQTFDLRAPGDPRQFLAVAAGMTFTSAPKVAIGAIVLAKDASKLNTSAASLARDLALPLAIVLALALIVTLFISRRITQPVMELADATEQVAHGLYDVHIRSKGRDEIGVLASRFELMAARLKEADEHERNFLMRISHELRTPLTAIQGHVQALADDVVEDPDERAASLEVVQVEAERLQRLIGDLLDLSKLEAKRFSLNVEQVDMWAVCDLAVQARREAARQRQVTVALEPFAETAAAADPAALIVAGDGDRILQIVGNLLDNAVRWSPPGGRVVVAAGVAGDRVAVAVTDSGPGVPEDQRDAIFRPFVSKARDGTGLGLAVSSELSAAMGGTLEVGDAPGGGAEFTLRLPRLSRPSVDRAPAGAVAPAG
jgi:two-component system sensor histidine kinase BaeS